MPERYHPGEDRDPPELRDVQAEPDRGQDILEGDYEPDGEARPPEEVDTVAEEVAACRFCREQFERRDERLAHHCEKMREWRSRQSWTADQPSIIQPGIHEFGAHLLFHSEEHGMAPYFAIVSQFDGCLQDTFQNENGATVSSGDSIGVFEAAGERWQLNHDEEKVKYWTGKIATRKGDSGQAYYEYNIGVVADDAVGRKRVNFQFRPALPDATHVDTGDLIQSLPDDLPLGVRVEIDAANVPKDQLVDVLQGLAKAMEISPDYFRREHIHEWSRVFNFALYVRLYREIAEEHILNRTGLLERLADFGSQRDGRGEFKWDNQVIKGHRNAVAMDERNLSKFFPNHHVGKLLKSYYRKEPGPDAPENDPTTQPKLEVQYSSNYSEHGSLPWSSASKFDVDDLQRELDEYLCNCLEWAGVSLDPADGAYVDDEYWEVEATDRDVRLYSDPMHELRVAEEGAALYHVVNGEATPAQRDVLATLTDGGPMHVAELAEASGTSESTVYRAIQSFADAIESVNGVVQMADDVIRSKFEELFETLESAADWVARGAQAIRDSDSLLSDDTAFASWARRYGATIDERGERFDINFKTGTFERHEIRKVLRAGYRAARDTGLNTAEKLMDSTVTYHDVEAGKRELVSPYTNGTTFVRALGLPADTLG